MYLPGFVDELVVFTEYEFGTSKYQIHCRKIKGICHFSGHMETMDLMWFERCQCKKLKYGGETYMIACIFGLLLMIMCEQASTKVDYNCKAYSSAYTYQCCLRQYSQYIHISNCAVCHSRNIEPESFHGLKSLENLVLRNNFLVSLDSAVFSQLSKLYRLDLSFNQLASISPSLFSELCNLDSLRLAHNNLVELTSSSFAMGIFDGLDSLNILTICKIPTKGFQLLPKLARLEMNTCKMASVMPRFIQYLNNLDCVILHTNILTHIPDYAFTTPSHLTTIDLRCNKIAMVKGLAFFGLTTLREIYLEDNQLHSIDSLNISGPVLWKLDLHNNQVCFPLVLCFIY